MKKILLLTLLFFLPLFAHEKPWKVTGSFMYSEGRPLECHLFTSMALIQETFDIETLRDDFYSEEMEDNIKRWILNVRSRFIDIRHDNIPLEAFIKDITIVPDEDADANLPPGKYALKDVDISISFLFSVDDKPDELSIKWLYTPEPLLDLLRVEGKRIAPADSEIAVTFTGNDISHYTVSAEAPVFRWKNHPEKTESIIPQSRTVLVSEPSHRTEILIIGSFLLIALCWAFIRKPLLREVSMGVIGISCCGVLMLVDLNLKMKKVWFLPEQAQLEEMMTRRLTDIYRGTSSSDPGMLFERLQRAASGEFLDNTFVDLFKSKVEQSETVQMIEKVTLENCITSGDRQVECSWKVKAFILHQGHIHEKDLSYRALFRMSPESGKWLIESGEIIPVYEEENT